MIVKVIIEQEGNVLERLQQGMNRGFSYYRQDLKNYSELGCYDRLSDLWNLETLTEGDIRSSGYVVHTLEAAIWSLINASSYEETVLKAVNLGDDTDTVGGVTGGLAGLYYGYDSIPKKWINTMQRRDWVWKKLSQGNWYMQ